MSHEILKINKGDKFSLSVTVNDEDGVAVDITGATLFFTVSKFLNREEGEAVIVKNVTSHSDPVNGVTSIPLLSADTDEVNAGVYYWDIRIKFANDDVLTFVSGDKLEIVDHVTKRTTS